MAVLGKCKLEQGDVKSCRSGGLNGWLVRSRRVPGYICLRKCRLRLCSIGMWDLRALLQPLYVFVSPKCSSSQNVQICTYLLCILGWLGHNLFALKNLFPAALHASGSTFGAGAVLCGGGVGLRSSWWPLVPFVVVSLLDSGKAPGASLEGVAGSDMPLGMEES